MGNGIQVISEDAEGEDSHGERVASIATVATKELGDDLVVVLCTVSDTCSITQALTAGAVLGGFVVKDGGART